MTCGKERTVVVWLLCFCCAWVSGDTKTDSENDLPLCVDLATQPSDRSLSKDRRNSSAEGPDTEDLDPLPEDTDPVCLAGMLTSLIDRLDWPNVVIVFNHTHGLLTELVTDNLSRSGRLFTLVSANEAWAEGGLRTLVKRGHLLTRRKLHLLLLCSAQCSLSLLRDAMALERELGPDCALRMTSRWLLMRTDNGSSVEDFRTVTMDNLALLAPAQPANEGERGERDSSCPFALQTLLWKKQGRELSPAGWLCDCGRAVHVEEAFPNTRLGLNGRRLTISTIQSLTFLKKARNQSYTGIGKAFVDSLALSLNFTYELVEVADGEYGSSVGDGKWNGLVGVLQRKEADLVVAKLTLSYERSQVVDFTTPFSRDYYTFCYRRPQSQSSRWTLYFRPFRWQVLACLGGTAVVTGTLLHVLSVLSPACPDCSKAQGWRGFGHCLNLVFRAILQRDAPWTPEVTSARLLAYAWWLLCVVMAAAYMGALVAVLAVSSSPTPLRSLRELVEQSTYTWGTKLGTYLAHTLEAYHVSLQTSTEPVMRAVWSGILRHRQSDPTVLSSNSTQLFLKVINEDYVLLAESAFLQESAARQGLQLQCGDSFLPDLVALATPKHSPLTDIFTQVVLDIVASGLYFKWQRTWLRLADRDSQTPRAALRSVGLPDTLLLFLSLLLGLVLAALVLLVENIVHRRGKGDNSTGAPEKTST